MQESKLKCVGISDIHGLLPGDLPPGDLLFIAEDISSKL